MDEPFTLLGGTRVTPLMPFLRQIGIVKETPAGTDPDGTELSFVRFRSIPDALAEGAEEFLSGG